MTREEMCKLKFKAYMSIEYKDYGMTHPAECLLSAVDFDAEQMKLTPLNDFYEQREFWGHIQFCSLSNRMKMAAKNGKKIPDTKTNEIKAKKIGIWLEDEDDLPDAS